MLKRILGIMIVIFIMIIAGGGLYLASMGGMNHGSTDNQTAAGGDQSTDPSQGNNEQSNPSHDGTMNDTAQSGDQQSGEQAGIDNKEKATDNQNNPIIVQVAPQTPQVDSRIYVEQLKQKLKSIDETNTSIAGSSDGKSTALGFYKLGRDLAEMEVTLDNLTDGLNQQVYMIPQQSGQFSGTGPLNQGQQLPQDQAQNGQQAQNTQQHGASQQNMSGTNGDTTAMNHSSGGSSLGNILNAGSMQNVFGVILLISIILAIVAVVGFIGSLFKESKAKNDIISE